MLLLYGICSSFEQLLCMLYRPLRTRCIFHRQVWGLMSILRFALLTVLDIYLTDVHFALPRSENGTSKSLLTHFCPRTPPSPAISAS